MVYLWKHVVDKSINEKNKHFDKDEHSLSSFNMCIINNTRRESLSYAHHYGVAIKSPEIWTSQYPAINFNWASKKKVQNSKEKRKENKHVKYDKADTRSGGMEITRSGGVEIPMYSRTTQHDKVMYVSAMLYKKIT